MIKNILAFSGALLVAVPAIAVFAQDNNIDQDDYNDYEEYAEQDGFIYIEHGSQFQDDAQNEEVQLVLPQMPEVIPPPGTADPLSAVLPHHLPDFKLPPTNRSSTALPPSSNNTVTVLPPTNNRTVTALPPSSNNTVTVLPPSNNNTVTVLTPTNNRTVTVLPSSTDQYASPSNDRAVIVLPPLEQKEKTIVAINSETGTAVFVSDPLYLTKQYTTIELNGNSTTGYRWTYKITPNNGVVEEKASGYNATASGKMGSGGTFNYVFKALKPGRTKLVFSYQRPWENKAPAKEVVVIINVAKDLSITTDKF